MGQIIINLPESANESDIQKLVQELRSCSFLVEEKKDGGDWTYGPEEGEYVTCENESGKLTAIFIKYSGDKSQFTAYASLCDGTIQERDDSKPLSSVGIRKATEEEIAELNKKLASIGKKWNPYDCEFEECEPYEAIQTYEDAFSKVSEMAANGNELAECLIKDLQFNAPYTQDLLAYIKLRIVVFAINDGWTPKFEKNEYRYYPWFDLYTKEYIDNMTDEQREYFKEIKGRVLGRSNSNASADEGVAYSFTYGASSYSFTSYGARLCFFDRARAEYAGRHFLDLYVAMNLCMTLEEEK